MTEASTRGASSATRAVLFATTGLVAMAGLFYLDRVVSARSGPDAVWVGSDLTTYFEPTFRFIASELKTGNLPIWNPYPLAGQPLLGLHVPGLLYPPSLVFAALLPGSEALDLHAVFHLALAGIFTFLFARRLGCGVPASTVAGLGYLLAAPTFLSIQMVAYLSTQVWLPAQLLSLHALLEAPRPRWAFALALSTALAFLGGHAQGFLFEMQLLACYGAFGLAVVTRPGARLRAIGLAGLAGLLAFGLAAPQILPALELAGRGARGLGLAYPVAAFGALEPGSVASGLLGALVPGIPPDQPNSWSVFRLTQWTTLGLPLALAGALAARFRAYWAFFAATALLTGLFMLGNRGGVFWLYYQLPGGDLFRGPMRISFVYAFAAALLWGLGTQGVVGALHERGRGRLAAAIALGIVAVVAVDLYVRSDLPAAHPIASLRSLPAPEDFSAQMRASGDYRFFDGGMLFGGVRDQPPRLGAKAGILGHLHAAPDYEPSMPRDYARYFHPSNTPRVWHGGIDLEKIGQGPREGHRLLDLMGLRFFAVETMRRHTRAPAHIKLLFPDGQATYGRIETLERRSALPRAYRVDCARVVPDQESALREIFAQPFDPDREAILTRPEDAQVDTEVPLCAPSARRRRALPLALSEPSTQEVRIEAECDSACVVVLSDLHYPGWTLEVDGRPRAIETANAIFRGVVLGPGRHQLVYLYRPRSLALGTMLAAIAAASMLACVGLRRA